MSQLIRLNISEFETVISALQSSASGIDSSVKTSRTFEKTNIKPLTKDLEQVIKSIELVQKYQTSLHKDIETLERIGENLKQKDAALAKQQANYGHIPY